MTLDLSSIRMPGRHESDLLERYLSGSMDKADAERIERWLDGNPRAKMVVSVFLDGVTGREECPPDSREFLESLRAQIRERDGVGQDGHTPSEKLLVGYQLSGWRTMRRSLWPTLVAAVVAVMAIVVGRRVMAGTNQPGAPAVSTYVTGNGQRANITLSDGSTVALNVGSRLDVPVDYSSGNHTLRLSGEALFTVNKNNGPFIVVAGATTARVLGTSFVVRHYATDTTAMIAVRSGKVAVRSSIVTAGQELEENRNGLVVIRPVDVSRFGFATGVLMLNDVPLPRAIPELDRWYNADVRLGDPSLANRVVTGDLPAGSLTDLMTLLQVAFDVQVVRDGRILTLFPR